MQTRFTSSDRSTVDGVRTGPVILVSRGCELESEALTSILQRVNALGLAYWLFMTVSWRQKLWLVYFRWWMLWIWYICTIHNLEPFLGQKNNNYVYRPQMVLIGQPTSSTFIHIPSELYWTKIVQDKTLTVREKGFLADFWGVAASSYNGWMYRLPRVCIGKAKTKAVKFSMLGMFLTQACSHENPIY